MNSAPAASSSPCAIQDGPSGLKLMQCAHGCRRSLVAWALETALMPGLMPGMDRP